MLLTDVRARLQFQLASFFRRQTKEGIPVELDERWLTQQETAQMLQPHMPKRNAFAWLELDRNVDPSLPFFEQQGRIAYRLGDVRAFIRRMPKDKSDQNLENGSLREFFDRRNGDDRRDGEYLEAHEERRQLIDRRSGFDRRNGFERRQVRDDFGYGRNGDRRGLMGRV